MAKEKIVLAYSGGLDTSIIIQKYNKNLTSYGYNVKYKMRKVLADKV